MSVIQFIADFHNFKGMLLSFTFQCVQQETTKFLILYSCLCFYMKN